MTDWQNIVVLLVVLAALAYVGRRGLARLRSLRARGDIAASSCATGCGNCAAGPAQAPSPRQTIVQIKRPRTTPRAPAR